MAIEIYWGSGSPFAWRVLLAAELKGIDYESHQIQFSKKEHKSPQFLAMNPRGKVPTLRDGDFAIGESLAIMVYLDRRFPQPALFGKDAREAAVIMRGVCDCMFQIDTRADRLVRPAFHGTLEARMDDAVEAAGELAAELDGIDKEMNGSKWWLGDAISAADLFLYPGLQLMERVLPKTGLASIIDPLLPLADKFPNIARWEKRIEAFPWFDKTYPPHWKE